MKQTFIKAIFASAIVGLTFMSCNDSERNIETTQEVGANAQAVDQPGEVENICSYVDGNWSSNAVLRSGLKNATDTNFMKAQMTKISKLFGRSNPLLSFVEDPYNQNSTYNAISYSTGKIYYGYSIYYDAKAKGGDIVNAMILAHEYGHQLQYIYNLPSVRERTARPNELQADGFAGYYLRKPAGYNQSSFAAIAKAYEFAASIGDYSTTSANHHGTPAQRRSAVRLGFLLAQYDLSAKDFDSNFFYYYNGVLNGSYRMARPSTVTPEFHAFMLSHMEELGRIANGQMSDEEYKNL